MVDEHANARLAKQMRLMEPVSIAMWLLEAERATARDRRRVARLRELVGSMG